MFTIYAGDMLLYSPAYANDKAYAAYDMHCTQELNRAGSLSFILQPTNRAYDAITLFETELTAYDGDELIFRGRAVEISVDTFLQKTIYCEGELSYFVDSIQRPYEHKGKIHALFEKLITAHNSQVEARKQFTVGSMTAVDAEKTAHVKSTDYGNTFSEITGRLLDAYGGYLKIRSEGGVRYIDWLSDYAGEGSQPVEFGVNIVDLDASGNSNDIFTVLIPLGAAVEGSSGGTAPLTIASVNDGKDYIEDPDAIARYGRIVRTYTWGHIEDANTLLERAREYLAYGVAENETLQIRAVDMHLLHPETQRIGIGEKVLNISRPHSIERRKICAKIDYDFANPESTMYTFGEKKKTFTENFVRIQKKVGGGGMGTGLEEEALWLQRWADVIATEKLGTIELLSGQLDEFTGRLTTAEITLDGVEAEIELKVSENELISKINMSPEEITISANKINLSGYVTASQLEAKFSDFEHAFADTIQTDSLTATSAWFVNAYPLTLHVGSKKTSWGALTMGDIVSTEVLGVDTAIDLSHSHAVTVASDGTVTLGEVSSTGGNFNIADTKIYKDAVSAAKSSVTLSKGSWSAGAIKISASNGKSVSLQMGIEFEWTSDTLCKVTVIEKRSTGDVSTGTSTYISAP